MGLLAPLVGFITLRRWDPAGRLSTLIVSVIGLVQTRGGHDPEGRRQALVGNALGVVLLLVVFGAASTGGDAPRINRELTGEQVEKGAYPSYTPKKRPGGSWSTIKFLVPPKT